MAIAVPILASAFGASAAIGTALGISAGMATVAIGVLTTVSGIGAKIDKAAAKVFGKDLVMAANLVGGFAMAAGWNPADGLKLGNLSIGGAGAGGTSATSIDGLGATIDAAGGVDAVANGGITGAPGGISIDPSTGMPKTVPTPGQTPQRLAELRGYSSDPNAVTGPAIAAGGTPKGVLEQVGGWFDKQPERVKAALITVGGQAAAGAAQGFASAKEEERAIQERKRREKLFNSGSGTEYTYQPGVLPQTRG